MTEIKRTHSTHFAVFLLTLLLFLSAPALPAHAAEDSGTEADGSGVTAAAGTLYRQMRTVLTAVGVLGMAGSGVQIVFGNAQNADRAVSRMIVTGTAIAALYLLPAVISMGAGWMRSAAWSPK